MATTNYNLPTITGNMNADVVRDMNALAEATDTAIKQAVGSVDLSVVESEITNVSDDLAAHLAEKATETELGHVTQSVESVNGTVPKRLPNGSIKAGVSPLSISGQTLTLSGRNNSAFVESPQIVLERVLGNGSHASEFSLLVVNRATGADVSSEGLYYIVRYGSSKKIIDIVNNANVTVEITADNKVKIQTTGTCFLSASLISLGVSI